MQAVTGESVLLEEEGIIQDLGEPYFDNVWGQQFPILICYSTVSFELISISYDLDNSAPHRSNLLKKCSLFRVYVLIF